MIYKEEIKDLFTVSDNYYLAHCISADFKNTDVEILICKLKQEG